MMAEVTLNVQRVRALADKIEEHDRSATLRDLPSKFDMSSYFEDGGRNLDRNLAEKAVASQEPPCGTTACVAGWAMFMFGTADMVEKNWVEDRWYRDGEELLGMHPEQASLFGCTGWDTQKVVDALRMMADKAARGLTVNHHGRVIVINPEPMF